MLEKSSHCDDNPNLNQVIMRYIIIIPTYNGGEIWKMSVNALSRYCPSNLDIQIIDSSSKDDTVITAKNAGFDVVTISNSDFNHGGTRNLAVEMHFNTYDVVVFLTQDAIPGFGFIERLLDAFDDPMVACAYGRQLPHHNANLIAQHARYFNYPESGYVCSFDDVSCMGIRAVFLSNSFSAYRISAFKQLGGFPSNTILCEDMFFAARAVLAGYKIAYVANAVVKHSHNYSLLEEFRRYFDIGVFHANEPWIREKFSGAGNEGKKFIYSEFCYLLKHGVQYIPFAFLNNFMKLLGYKLGQKYKKLPRSVVIFCSMHKVFWHN